MLLSKLAKESGACMAAGGIVGKDRQSIVNRLKGRNQAGATAASYAAGGIIPNFGDDSKSGLNARLAAMQASNGRANGSATAQFNTPEQNAAMNSQMPQAQPAAQGLTTQPAVGQQAPTTFQQDLDARQERMTSLSGRLKSMENAARSGADISSPFGTNVPKNFAQGGIVARAFQFKGKGGPVDDEIPVKVAGQNINVSNGEKAVVLPAKTAQNPQAVTAIEDVIEQSNGKPTNRDGGNSFAAGGEIDAVMNGPSNGLTVRSGQSRIAPTSPAVGTSSDQGAGVRPSLTNPQDVQAAIRTTTMPAGSRSLSGIENPFGGQDISGKKLITNVGGDGTAGMSAMDAPLANVPGSSPIPTVPGLSLSQRAGNPNLGTADDNIRQLENIQKANAMMTPQGGAAFLADPNDAANAEKTARWRQDDMIAAIKGGVGRSGKAALGRALSAQIQGDNQQQIEAARGQQQANIAQMQNDAHVQSLTLQTQAQKEIEASRSAGNQLDRQLTTTKVDSAKRIANLQSQYLAERNPERRAELEDKISVLSGHGKASDNGPTLAQQRSNSEIDAARQTISGLTPDDIKRKTAKTTNTGRENPDFDPALERAAGLANRRKIGDDGYFDQRQQATALPQPQGDVAGRFGTDPAMKGHAMGKVTPNGIEVLDASGKLIGHYQ